MCNNSYACRDTLCGTTFFSVQSSVVAPDDFLTAKNSQSVSSRRWRKNTITASTAIQFNKIHAEERQDVANASIADKGRVKLLSAALPDTAAV